MPKAVPSPIILGDRNEPGTRFFFQLRRDRLTFGMIVGLPVVQLLLFGYAINNDPKHMPAALVLGEQSQFTRSVEGRSAIPSIFPSSAS